MPLPASRYVDLAVVGGGAAGLTSAIFAAAGMPGRTVAVLDGSRHPGAKILVAGGGRCNVTNGRVTAAAFSGGSRNSIKRVLAALPVEQTVAWFARLGVNLHEEEHGKLFPDSNQARTVLNALLAELKRSGGQMWAEHRVTAVQRLEDGGFLLATNQGDVCARKLVLATGGMSLPKTGSDGAGYELARSLGHSVVPTTPGLVPLVLDDEFHAGLSGISQEVELSVVSPGEKPVRISGSLLWTHFGISGPAVLDASRHWLRARLEGQPAAIVANLLPGRDPSSADHELVELTSRLPRTMLRNALAGWMPGRVLEGVVASLGIDGSVPLAHLTRDARRRLVQAIVAWPLPVRESRGYHHAEVTAGGVTLNEVDPAGMQSRRCPGLYLAGEILDVDGRIGGFNFQWAWASGYAAGRAVSHELQV